MLKPGAGAGLIAGILFSIMLVATAAMNEEFPFQALGMFASLLMGEAALSSSSSFVMLVGTLVTVFLSTLFGVVYGLLNTQLSERRRSDWGTQALLGCAYGALLWLINFQGFSRLFFPWLVSAPQLTLLVAHALFFGVPLGIFFVQFQRSPDDADYP